MCGAQNFLQEKSQQLLISEKDKSGSSTKSRQVG